MSTRNSRLAVFSIHWLLNNLKGGHRRYKEYGGWTNHGASSGRIPARSPPRSRGRGFRSLGDPGLLSTTHHEYYSISRDRRRMSYCRQPRMLNSICHSRPGSAMRGFAPVGICFLTAIRRWPYAARRLMTPEI